MKIGIIGAGFSGAALSYYFDLAGHDVTVFDQKGLGGGASGVAAGLLHPYVGAEAKKNWRADEGMAETVALLEASSERLGEAVFTRSGIERIPIDPKQAEAFEKALSLYPDIEKTERGILITSGILVDCRKYLKGLLRGNLVIRKIESLDELVGFDHIFIAAGYGTSPLTGEILHPIKGQIVKVHGPRLKRPVIEKKYRVWDGDAIWIGATYEKKFTSEEPDLEVAERELCPGEKILDCQAGVRVFTPSKRPLVTSHILSGLGSKGLLYHALFAKEIANSVGYTQTT